MVLRIQKEKRLEVVFKYEIVLCFRKYYKKFYTIIKYWQKWKKNKTEFYNFAFSAE